MAENAPDVEETNRISPGVAVPRTGAEASARARIGVEEATCIRVWAAAESAQTASRARDKEKLRMVEFIAGEDSR